VTSLPKHNAANERIKRDYFEYLREAKRLSPQSIDAVAKALGQFEESTGWKDFRTFHIKQAVAFKNKLAQQVSQRTGDPLSSGGNLSRERRGTKGHRLAECARRFALVLRTTLPSSHGDIC